MMQVLDPYLHETLYNVGSIWHLAGPKCALWLKCMLGDKLHRNHGGVGADQSHHGVVLKLMVLDVTEISTVMLIVMWINGP
jgi:hypothetical protein